MAIYHINVKVISRSTGRSAVAASAYRSAERFVNEYDGQIHDYSKKTGVVHTEILTPTNAPEWANDRERLWNAVEKVENAVNSQLAREVSVALPKELNRDEQIRLVREYARENFINRGMVADIAIHDKGDGNPHAHIMLTMRPFEQDGTLGAKARKEYILDENGNKTYTEKGNAKSIKVSTTDWDKKETLEQWREAWAAHANTALERAGREERIDHRSLAEQGIDRVPQVHLGPNVVSMERKGIETDRGERYREIAQINAQINELTAQQTVALAEYKALKEEKEQLTAAQPAQDKWLYYTPEERRAVLNARNVMTSYVDLPAINVELTQIDFALQQLERQHRDLRSEANRFELNEPVMKAIYSARMKIGELSTVQRLLGPGRQLEASIKDLTSKLQANGFTSAEEYLTRSQAFEKHYTEQLRSIEGQRESLTKQQDTLVTAKAALENVSERQNNRPADKTQTQIIYVSLSRHEGYEFECGTTTVNDLRAADEVLRSWGKTAPASGRGHRCDYNIRLSNGETLGGAFYVTKRDAMQANLAKYVVADMAKNQRQVQAHSIGGLISSASTNLFRTFSREAAQAEQEGQYEAERAARKKALEGERDGR